MENKSKNLNVETGNKKTHNHPWLKTRGEVMSWLKKYDENYISNEKKYIIDDNLEVSIPIITIKKYDMEYLPVKFDKTLLFTIIEANNLKSLIGLPYKTRDLTIMKVKNLESLEGFNIVDGKTCFIDCDLKSMKGMPFFLNELVIQQDNEVCFEDFTYAVSLDYEIFFEKRNSQKKVETQLVKLPLESIERLKFDYRVYYGEGLDSIRRLKELSLVDRGVELLNSLREWDKKLERKPTIKK